MGRDTRSLLEGVLGKIMDVWWRLFDYRPLDACTSSILPKAGFPKTRIASTRLSPPPALSFTLIALHTAIHS